jgi:hypothetical protein
MAHNSNERHWTKDHEKPLDRAPEQIQDLMPQNSKEPDFPFEYKRDQKKVKHEGERMAQSK